jgi:hypothetical protein
VSRGTTVASYGIPNVGCELMFDAMSSCPVTYPSWMYYPSSNAPPNWVHELIDVVRSARPEIESFSNSGLNSDMVLLHLRPGLERLGYTVETSKKRAGKVRRPVLFGEGGTELIAYEVDAVNDDLGVLLEVEAGRGAMSNALYRDLIRTSLIVGARYLALGVMIEYRYSRAGVAQSFRDTKGLLDAIHASGRRRFPFDGILLFGY